MRKLNIIILLALISHYAQSQSDTLVTVNNYKVPVTITEITAREVIYRLPNKPDMPLLHYARYNLKEIILKDGSSINPYYKTVDPFAKKEKVKDKVILYFTPTKLFINQIGVAIERISSNNHIGVRVPFSFAYSDPYQVNLKGSTFNSSFDNKRFWSTGIDINIYPFRLGRFKYVIGTSFQYAHFGYLQYYSSTTILKERGAHYSFLISNGFISQIGKHFIINGTTGIGIQAETYDYTQYSKNTNTDLRLNTTINFGYIF